MVPMCKLLGKSKQAYYKHEDTEMARLALESFVVEYIKGVRKQDPGIGGEKLWEMYRKKFGRKNRVGYNRFYDIIEKYDLKVRKRKTRVKTTDSNHDLPLYPNLVKNVIPDHPNQVWVSDITYIPIYIEMQDGTYEFCYLSLITDCYTKEIVGWSVGDSLETKFPMEALMKAMQRFQGKVPEGLIHHSDRGVQYASYAYTAVLREANIQISMTESGNPKDNAVAERVNNTIKNELLKDMVFTDISQVIQAVSVAVDFYNNERPHMSLDGMTPAEASKCTGEIKKRWHSYRENAIKNLQV